jgi:RpiB/LacA/LacB family sugar-phosphate isomerase
MESFDKAQDKKVFIASDHAGFLRKEEIKNLLKSKKIAFEDLGPAELEPGDDYPDFGQKVAEAVSTGKGIGILICDTGIGMDIVANKHKGVRASLATNAFMAKRAKEHNNANILVLGSEVSDWTASEQIVMTWLLTPFSGEERHIRRLKKIEEIEAKHG